MRLIDLAVFIARSVFGMSMHSHAGIMVSARNRIGKELEKGKAFQDLPGLIRPMREKS
jgi:hypothetical protein